MDLDVLVIGGGIHGVGVLHDLASRGVTRCALVEVQRLASGTSSRSTKLIHGGLRYLEQPSNWPLVFSALQERSILRHILPEFVKPVPLLLPITKQGRPPWMLKAGLALYDLLSSGPWPFPSAQSINLATLKKIAPYLGAQTLQNSSGAFLFYDAQMVDDALVRLAAHASVQLGAEVWEHQEVTHLRPTPQGFEFQILNHHTQQTQEGRARAVVNAAGVWANQVLAKWGIIPNVGLLLNSGSHFVFESESAPQDTNQNHYACFLQNQDNRVLFLVPWQGKWLWGTTEAVFNDPELRKLTLDSKETQYLTQAQERFLDLAGVGLKKVDEFKGLRGVPVRPHKPFAPLDQGKDLERNPYYCREIDENISEISRETVLDQTISGLWCIYGGKYTTFRHTSQKLGAQICRFLGKGENSKTSLREYWFFDGLNAHEKENFLNYDRTLWRI
jgi:glycerol-3-phosphate dehydrogenase